MSKVCAMSAEVLARSYSGRVTAAAYVEFVDFNGMSRRRRVPIGVEYSVSLDTAKSMAENIRKGNPDHKICVQYSEEL